MFNYRLIKTGHAICWLGCCPHLWGVPCDWLAMCERELSPVASVICQPPTGMMSNVAIGCQWAIWNDEQPNRPYPRRRASHKQTNPSLAPPAQDGAEGLYSARKDVEPGS